ncbi:MAG: ABC transporter permease [Methanomassiliicoccales archaeon]|jgi:ABC-2 type transport system permease protein
MSGLSRIIGKEIKELLTPATLIPIIIMAVIFGSMGSAFSGVTEDLDEKPEFGIVIDDIGNLSSVARLSLVTNSVITFDNGSLDEGLSELNEGSIGSALVYIPGNFTSNIESGSQGWVEIFYYKTGTGLMDLVQSSLVLSSVTEMSEDISMYMISNNMTAVPSIVISPVEIYSTTFLNGNEMAGVTPDQIDTVFQSSGFIVPIIVMLVIIMAGGMVITSMGSEKENKTLETLLTLPVKRTWIVFGKLAGATIVGLIMSMIYMVGLGYYYDSLMSSATIDLAGYGLSLGIMDYAIVGVSLFLALLCGLAICMILGIFTKNFKAAQSMTLPVTMLAMIPMLISLFSDFGSLPAWLQAIVFAIPFSHPMFAVNNLMLGDYTIVFAGIAYTAGFAIVMMAFAVALFKKDILLTGRIRNTKEKSKFQNPLWSMLRKR